MGTSIKGTSPFLLLTAAALFFATGAVAQEAVVEVDAEKIKGLQESFEDISNRWFVPLQEIARNMLYATALIGLTWKMLPAVVQGADLGETLWIVTQHLIIVGLFLALINNAPAWTGMIIDGFKDSASVAMGGQQTGTLQASTIASKGWDIAAKITTGEEAGLLSAINPARWIIALLIILIYCALAGYILLVIAEAYLMTSFGVLMLGFAGSDLTSDIAKRYIMYTLSIGAKLYALFLVVGIGEQLINEWAANLEYKAMLEGLAIVGVLFMMFR